VTLDLTWVPVGAGRLALWHRPGRKHLTAIRDAGCSHLVTLLSEREGAREIGEAATNAGFTWIWLPLPNSDEPVGAARAILEHGLSELSRLLDEGRALLIHCSAGIHRTGMTAYALLRHRGLDREQALSIIGQSRAHTRDGVQERHLRWGDDLSAHDATITPRSAASQER
jgi:predicted protein tyrosine phosphatase